MLNSIGTHSTSQLTHLSRYVTVHTGLVAVFLMTGAIMAPTGFYTWVFPWAAILLLLAVLPSDQCAITFVTSALFIFYSLVTLIQLYSTISANNTRERVVFLLHTIFLFIVDVGIFPALRCGSKAMPPRQKLLRTWLASRFMMFTFGAIRIFVPLNGLARGNPSFLSDELNEGCGNLLFSTSLLLAGTISTRANRGRLRRWLGSLGSSGAAEQEAAAVASLMGGRSAAAAIETAKESFRALSVDILKESDMTDNFDAAGLYAQTTKCELGECDAFITHSWSDDGSAKFLAIREWYGPFIETETVVKVWLE